jgi:hypothetical protein
MPAVTRIEKSAFQGVLPRIRGEGVDEAWGPGSWGTRVSAGLLAPFMRRRRGELATGANPELAVDVVCVGADRLDTHSEGESDLCVRVTSLQQGEHLDLTPRQQSAWG